MAKSETVLVIPDSQNGFRGNEPLHDRQAWEAAIVLSTLVVPDQAVLLGDMVDFSTLTKKFKKPADLVGKMKKTIDETNWWYDRLDQVLDYKVMIEGNHEARLSNILIDCNADLEGLVTVESLLKLETRPGWTFRGPYGQDYTYRGVDYVHGEKYAKTGGQTAAKYLVEHPRSVVFGHCHKAEIGRRRYRGVTRFAACPGTIARIDGIVPGNHVNPDWQQGLGLVHYPSKGNPWYEQVDILDGNMLFRGEVIPIKHDARKRQKELGF